MNLVSNGWPSSSSLALRSDSPCVSSGFLHHRMNTFAYRLPVFFPASLFHLHLYFTEILSVLTAQCRYCPTFIHNYTELIRCKDTTFIFITSNFCLFFSCFSFSAFYSPLKSTCGKAVFLSEDSCRSMGDEMHPSTCNRLYRFARRLTINLTPFTMNPGPLIASNP